MMRDNRMPLGQVLLLLFVMGAMLISLILTTIKEMQPLRIIYAATDDTDQDLYIVDVDKKFIYKITQGLIDRHECCPSVSPDGRKVVFTTFLNDPAGSTEL